MKTVCILGLGHIGLPTACLFATHSYYVVGVDTNKEVVNKINRGEAPFGEPGLEELLQKALKINNFIARTEPGLADVFIIATPTPLEKEARIADLIHVQEAARNIARFLKQGDMVILESTVPPGASERLLLPILEGSGLKGGQDFHLVHCPERAIPGNTINEMIHSDRIIGGINRESAELAKNIYSCFVKGNLYLTNLPTAETVKLMENTFRDINIALANELAQIAEASSVNIWEAIELANKHPRVNILKPGPGVGGHCLAIDPWFLTENSVNSRIISLAREINDSMPQHVLSLVKQLVGRIQNGTITVLGAAYKADVEDTRESPAIRFIKLSQKEGCQIKVHDPLAKELKDNLYTLEEAAQDSDCLVLITDHTQFKQIKPEAVSRVMRNKNLVDTRNLLNHEIWREAGFKVKILGDGTWQT
ncbi:nucleotide sugar dehydrogenase [Chloroflexota bacterium]